MARCKACGAEIEWIRLTSGKMHPCDAEKIFYKADGGRDRIVTPEGEIVAGTIMTQITGSVNLLSGYSSHFATCPFADEFRRH